MSKERLDVYLVNKKLISSRSKALELIKNNNVLVNDKVTIKPSFLVDDNDSIIIKDDPLLEYVSRGGLKLKKALNSFNISLKDLIIMDIGASTGGFTSCALKENAKLVYAIDVGSNQLHESLRNNNKVISIENTNFKDIAKCNINDKIDMYVCDVSFISLRLIIDTLKNYDENFTLIALFKPQFEVGRSNLNKNGVVKNKKIILMAINSFVNYLAYNDIAILDFTYSPIIGHHEGNIEYLFYLKNKGKSKQINYNSIIEESYAVLKVK